MRRLGNIFIFALALFLLYLVGPHPASPKYDKNLPAVPSIDKLEDYVTIKESLHKLRTDNQARIVWNDDSSRVQTPYSIVYLHGFSASQEEGNPVHRNAARAIGANLFLARLAEHGIDTTDQLINLTVDKYWKSAQEALMIGAKLGKKVILMATSTGATQALQLAALYPEKVNALILYSPNIAINDGNAWVLNNPWGLQLARMVKQGKYNTPSDTRAIYKQYWNIPYRLEAAAELQEMLETSMTNTTFKKINQPLLMLYYYKDEQHQDDVVKVKAMQEMFEKISTPANLKRAVALPNTGNHVIASPIKSKDIISVEAETKKFLYNLVQNTAVQ